MPQPSSAPDRVPSERPARDPDPERSLPGRSLPGRSLPARSSPDGSAARETTAAAAADHPPVPVTRFSPWLVLATLCLGFFMILLDTTIVNIAIPDMVDSLHATLNQILWIINAYVLVYAVLLITAGRLGDLYGSKKLFIAGLVVFTAASASCGFASDPNQLIISRIIQGVGGALLTPQTLSTLTVIFPPDKRGAAFGIWGAVAGVATIAGPTLGGWLVTDFSWRWIFFVNLPVGILAIILGFIVMPDLRLNRHHRIDWAGTALVSIGLFLICFGLIEGQSYNWGKVRGPVTIPMIIGAGLLVIALFLVQQWRAQRTREPLVPFALFADRNFSLMNVVAAGISFAMLGMFLPLTIYFQSVLGLTALQAGLTIAPMSLVSMVVAPFAGRLADRIGGKYVLFTGLTLWSIGMATIIFSAHPASHRIAFLPGLLIAGLGLGQTFAPLQTLAMHDVKPRMAGAASGLINTTRQLGGVIGSAAVGALLESELASHLRSAAISNAAALPPQARQQFVTGFSTAASKGLEVGAGQTGAQIPTSIPAQLRSVLVDAATRTFHDGFTAAMRTSLILPIAVLALAVACVLFVKRWKRDRDTGATAPREEAVAAGRPAA